MRHTLLLVIVLALLGGLATIGCQRGQVREREYFYSEQPYNDGYYYNEPWYGGEGWGDRDRGEHRERGESGEHHEGSMFRGGAAEHSGHSR